MKNTFSLLGMVQNLWLAALLSHAFKGDAAAFIQESGKDTLEDALDFYDERRARFLIVFPDAVFMFPPRGIVARMVNIWDSPLVKAVIREQQALDAIDAAYNESDNPENEGESVTMPAFFADYIENELDLSAFDSPAPNSQLRENGRAMYRGCGTSKECVVLKIHTKKATVLFDNKFGVNKRSVYLSSLTPID